MERRKELKGRKEERNERGKEEKGKERRKELK